MSTFFFILTPFGFFCTENGTGLIVGTIFLILGFVCKWMENGGLEPKIKIEPKDWWETNYRKSMIQGRGHEASRGIADYTTRSNHCPMPSEEEKERIAKSLGITTSKMEQDEEDRLDRIQAGKYYLMGELAKKYENRNFDKCINVFPYIKASQRALGFGRFGTEIGGDYGIRHRFKKGVVEFWELLSPEEKNIAIKWTQEYEKRLLKEIHNYIDNDAPMPTITKHYDIPSFMLIEYNKKYGFIW